ncbi:MAG: hypothetical protein A2219_04620 [Elusimicrobia bacterium RIFOXYA2_FULL_50_26]|nr:MAG: hypothetical protein A2219_04620 [Elusimicrobia bacterium RIFOXYA2_FULL_50_26]OGS23696.1 MAG: hypothetical protein A2314_01170 [Elusimicrobia bacterium RIFOXYB2_FULL_50_12]
MKKIINLFVIMLLLACSGAFAAAEEIGLKKGLLLLNEGKIDEALAVLREEVTKNPGNAEAHLALGVSYIEKGDYVSARGRLKEALALSPESVPAYYTLAMLYEKEKNFSDALQEWKNVLRFSKDKEIKELARKHIRHLEK